MTSNNVVPDDTLIPAPSQPEDDGAQTDSVLDSRQPEQARFHVDEIPDAIEAAEIDEELTEQEGVIGVTVNTIDQSVAVAYDPERVSRPLLREKIKETGLEASDR